ncbi:MAG: 30S ribosomal protein S4 [Candidatus Poribacteria bacterium]|nr:30S ribosomal protein S4 [Candidatus Poribacteria bacterium]
MSKYLKSVCKLCRREGEKLFLKGQRCDSPKCSFERRSYPPGQHGQQLPKAKDYGRQLRAKQKAKRIYGVFEKPFRNYYAKATRQRGGVGDNLLRLLECRLDNVVYRLGFATSRQQARQLVAHNHFLVNRKRVNIPSYHAEVGDVIQTQEKSRNVAVIQEALERSEHRGTPDWLELNMDRQEGVVRALPNAELLAANIQTQPIVELYSK